VLIDALGRFDDLIARLGHCGTDAGVVHGGGARHHQRSAGEVDVDLVTPVTSLTSSVTERTQCSQVMPATT
jgi:hypothetical protein